MSANYQQTDFSKNTKGLTSPASKHELITPPSATWDNTTAPRAIRADAAGVLVMADLLGNNVTYNVLQGEQLPIQVSQIVSGPAVQAWW